MMVECDRTPLVPVTFSLKMPRVDELTVSFEEPEPPDFRVTLLELKVVVSTLGDRMARLTVPANVLVLVNVMVVEAEDPTGTISEVELAAIVKFGR
jgi:hypothetical protein